MEFLVQLAGQSVLLDSDYVSFSGDSRLFSPPPPSSQAADRSNVPPDLHQSDELELIEVWNRTTRPADDAINSKSSNEKTLSGLRIFHQFASMYYRTTSPVVHSVLALLDGHPTILTEFAQWDLNRDTSPKPETVRRHITAVGKICGAAIEAGWIRRLPKKPAESAIDKMYGIDEDADEIPETVTLQEFVAIRNAVDIATWPRLGPSPAEFWRAFLDIHWTYGPRTQDWFAYQSTTKRGLLWDHLTLDPLCPSAKLKGLEWPHGWAWLPIGKTRTRRLLLPLSSRIRQHIDTWHLVDSERVFPMKNNSKSYSNQWKRILQEAEVDLRIRASEGDGGPSLRKGCGNFWQSKSESIEAYVLCHRDRSSGALASKHYVQRVKLVCDHIEDVPFACETQ